jgi:hypothetical protein
MAAPWPDMTSAIRAGETIRRLLDYLVWAANQMLQTGARAGPEQGPWRERVRQAYVSLFLPPVLGRGDPYPPDVPPALTPGIWPDVPAAGLTGMTLRHQLTVIGMLANHLRADRWLNIRPQEVTEWDRRLSRARTALDLGPDRPLPPEAQSAPSPAVIQESEARDRAIREHAKRRSRQIQRMLSESESAKSKRGKKPPKPAKAAKPTKPAAAKPKTAKPASKRTKR